MTELLTNWPDYELLDFGGGRKLERFGDRKLIRPCLAASNQKVTFPKLWDDAVEFRLNAQANNARGTWSDATRAPWMVKIGPIVAELKLTAFGHVGIFPEHFDHWRWAGRKPLADTNILHLFAYTGVFSLLLAFSGCQVTHVDSSAVAVRWARRNAELSNLNDAPIRWIVEDVLRFVRRELKRGVKYDGFIVDAPSYGRGPRNESWKIDRDLETLLDLLRDLASERLQIVLLSAHTPGFENDRLAEFLMAAMGDKFSGSVQAAETTQRDRTGRTLPIGSYARWQR